VPLDYYTWIKPTPANTKPNNSSDMPNPDASLAQAPLTCLSSTASPLIAPINPMAFPQYETLLEHFSLEYASIYFIHFMYWIVYYNVYYNACFCVLILTS
jgi:hypothetical protein